MQTETKMSSILEERFMRIPGCTKAGKSFQLSKPTNGHHIVTFESR